MIKAYYADWGGNKDAEETDCLITVAHEFYEEANGNNTLPISLEEVGAYLHPYAGNIRWIIKQSEAGIRRRNQVTYITEFTRFQFENFKSKFYESIAQAKRLHNLEKDKLCI